MNKEEQKKIIESVIFSSPSPVNVDSIYSFLSKEYDINKDTVKELLVLIESEHENTPVILKKVASGYTFQISEKYSEWVTNFYPDKPQKYSRAFMETLALIVYKQPITRSEIEAVRGVAVSHNIMKNLLELEWIKILGNKEVPGRPMLYGTTKKFLDSHNLSSLSDLPEIKDIDISQNTENSEQTQINLNISEGNGENDNNLDDFDNIH